MDQNKKLAGPLECTASTRTHERAVSKGMALVRSLLATRSTLTTAVGRYTGTPDTFTKTEKARLEPHEQKEQHAPPATTRQAVSRLAGEGYDPFCFHQDQIMIIV